MNESKLSGVALIKAEYIVPEAKKAKLEENATPATDVVKHERGQNKHRHQKYDRISEPKLCFSVLKDEINGACTNPKCKFIHSSEEYLKSKPPDVGNKCHVLQAKGSCHWGITCRFLSGHNDKVTTPTENEPPQFFTKDLQNQLRKKQYDFSKANAAIERVLNGGVSKETEDEADNIAINVDENNKSDGEDRNPREKRVIDFRGKLYLSPLTTLGNLPFRRICKEFGADITCGEMAMASSVLQGQSSEWALLRRHPSEDCFGVQLCGNNPYVLARSVQLIEETGVADFIDLNLGCPIDIVYQKGAGSGLLRREKNLENCVRSMVSATKLPVSVKTRTGIYDNKRIALNLMPMFKSAGAALITVHGRTREQRYTRNADWDYIDQCAKAADPVPVFGNGDILSYQDYRHALENSEQISGVMIGRGALYKPWIFQEIKEQRDWDITSSERLNILQSFVNYGFEHWGSDSRGVETTRRFLLEWLSFLYRYIPVGLLESPQRINERPPKYCGRDDLETLMASPNCADWVKISEMLCGRVPENYIFLPKHKANSWAN